MARMVLYGRKVAKLSEPRVSRRSVINNSRSSYAGSGLGQRQSVDTLVEREVSATIEDNLNVRRVNRQ